MFLRDALARRVTPQQALAIAVIKQAMVDLRGVRYYRRRAIQGIAGGGLAFWMAHFDLTAQERRSILAHLRRLAQ